MAEIVIDNLDDAIVAQLTRRAASAGWSLEREIRGILESAAAETAEMRGWERTPEQWAAIERVDAIRKSLEGTAQTDSAVLRRL